MLTESDIQMNGSVEISEDGRFCSKDRQGNKDTPQILDLTRHGSELFYVLT